MLKRLESDISRIGFMHLACSISVTIGFGFDPMENCDARSTRLEQRHYVGDDVKY